MRAALATRWPYLAWGAVSGLGLGVACAVHPYVFAFAALSAAWVCGGFGVLALWLAPRMLGWALLAALPTAASFVILGTYRWA